MFVTRRGLNNLLLLSQHRQQSGNVAAVVGYRYELTRMEIDEKAKSDPLIEAE